MSVCFTCFAGADASKESNRILQQTFQASQSFKLVRVSEGFFPENQVSSSQGHERSLPRSKDILRGVFVVNVGRRAHLREDFLAEERARVESLQAA